MSALEANLSLVDVRPGVRLGRYEILLGIAEGGMARVWAAKQHGQRGFSKVVAIKTILPALASDPSFEAMFLEEARVAAGVHHPNVCEIFDLGEERGVLYIAMEWVNGESLARIFKPAQGAGRGVPMAMDPRIGARIIAAAAAGLHSAHELTDELGQKLNVVHRDVSPQNILVSLTGTVKVTDFGVAKALGGASEATAAGQVKGKAAYMSPEQATGAQLDRRSDLFALGVCLYEVTTGQRPFQGENQVAVLRQLLSGAFAPPSAVLPNYPRELEEIVMTALEADPQRRFGNADQMRVALEEYLARSGGVLTEMQVAKLVQERVGPTVEGRSALIRERTRAAPTSEGPASFAPVTDGSSSKISNPSASAIRSVAVTTSPSDPSFSGQSAQLSYPTYSAPAPDNTARNALIGIGVGVGMFMAVGAGVVLSRGGDEPAPIAAPPAEAPAVPSPAPTAAKPPPPPPVKTTVTFSLIEPSAGVELLLDGKPLPTALSLPRPKAGEVKLITARAAGYQDDILRVDADTPDVLDVLLAKREAPTAEAKPSEPKATESRPALASTTNKPATPKPKPQSVDIPDNPF